MIENSYIPLAYEPDPRAALIRLIPWGLRDRPRLRAHIDAIGEQFGQLDEALYTFVLDSGLEQAEGDLLRRYGLLVDVPGAGLDEATHRRLIAGRIATTRSDGSRPAFGRSWSALTGGDVSIRDMYPATVSAVAVMDDYLSPRVASLTGRIAREALAAGVGSELVIATGNTMRFGAEPFFGGPTFAQLL